ncbi:MAG: ammonia channel protein [Dehalococcoidia bacterium]|nr:ammonia channel protein [Dehalococcoidia bacterium]
MPEFDSGGMAWMMVASALVLLMTPGLAFFYGGLVRAKNVVSTMMYSFAAMALMPVIWVLWGYSLAFGEGNAFIGDFSYVLLNGINMTSTDPAADIMFVIFQGMFAIITPALITGAFVERFKFSTYLIFITLWVTLVYAPICHWVWGGGWISQGVFGDQGALDFAGGTVVHLNAGAAALVAAWMVGKRRGGAAGTIVAHNVPYVILGASLLWFGWFGFNAGSELAADGVAANAFLTTNTAAAMAALTWLVISGLHTGKMSAVGAATGAVAGLVAITPACGWVDVGGALMIGLTVSIVCYLSAMAMEKSGIDDALVVFGVHGVGGAWGALMTGVFAAEAIGGVKGLIEGNGAIVLEQLVGILATFAYSAVVTFIILKILDVIPGLGLQEIEETELGGLDVNIHGERGYIADGAD